MEVTQETVCKCGWRDGRLDQDLQKAGQEDNYKHVTRSFGETFAFSNFPFSKRNPYKQGMAPHGHIDTPCSCHLTMADWYWPNQAGPIGVSPPRPWTETRNHWNPVKIGAEPYCSGLQGGVCMPREYARWSSGIWEDSWKLLFIFTSLVLNK